MTIYKIDNVKRISVFIFICILVSGLLVTKQMLSKRVKEYYTLYGVFEDIDGIFHNSDVRLSGKKIGIVSDIKLDKNMEIILEMHIDKSYKIPEDSSISIHTNGLLGSKYIEITAGGSPDNLEENDKITYSQSSINIMELFSQYIENIKIEQKK